MAEVGLASGLLTLIVFACGTSKSVYGIVSSFKSQRKVIKDVQVDLDSLLTVLMSIRDHAERSSRLERLEPLRQPLDCCATTCQEMREMLDACTAHSTNERNSIRDLLKMQYHEKSFEDMKKRLASYKSTLSIAFESINIQEHSVTQEVLDVLKDLIAATREDLEDQLDRVQRTISIVDVSAREILRGDIDRLQRSLDSIVRSQGVADTTRPKVSIERNRAEQGARAIFGTDTSQPQFNLAVSDNQAGIGAVMSAGVHSPETLRALLADSRTPDLALTLQALQTQSRNTQYQPLQSILHTLSTDGQRGLTGTPLATGFPGQMSLEDANAPVITEDARSGGPMQGVSSGTIDTLKGEACLSSNSITRGAH